MAASPRPKPPPAPWFRGIIRNPLEGMRVGTEVAFRRSREGGWRVMSRTRQALVSDERVAHYVITIRSGGKPVRIADQAKANDHLADIFRGRILIGTPRKGSPHTTDLDLGKD